MMDELLSLPSNGEIDLDAAYHTLRRSTFFSQHRMTPAEIAYHNEGRPVLHMLKAQAAQAAADFAVKHSHIKFREVPRHEVSNAYPYDEARFFKSQLTILNYEDADSLERTLRKLMKVYGPRIKYPR